MKTNRILFFICSFLLINCKSQMQNSQEKPDDSKLIGLWIYEEKDTKTNKLEKKEQLTLLANGSFNLYQEKFLNGEVDIDVSDDGKWRIEGEKLILDFAYVASEPVYKLTWKNDQTIVLEALEDKKNKAYFKKNIKTFVKQ